MNAQDLARLREGNADCPSDLALDRLHAGELQAAESQQLTAHVAACAICPQRMAARQAGFAALPETDPRPILSAIRRRLHETEREPTTRRWLRQLTLVFAPMAAATAALLVLIWVRRSDPDHSFASAENTTASERAGDQTRLKGSLGLHVYRLRDGQKEGAQGAISGDQFAPGDRLRFVVDLPSSGQVSIIGVESDGDLYVAWPSAGEPADATQRPAGRGQELPGAVALDNSPGPETLYLVHCPQASAPPRCTTQGAQARPQCGAGCSLVPFVINKNQGP